MDLHRRRSVLVRMTEAGQPLETVRIVNDCEQLAAVMARAGEDPEVVLEATYGWYWAVDALAELGGCVHLAHPLGVKGFAHRRVKNDERDAFDLADLLRMRRLPEAWIAPPATRELRELVRHRAKLVHLRTRACQIWPAPRRPPSFAGRPWSGRCCCTRPRRSSATSPPTHTARCVAQRSTRSPNTCARPRSCWAHSTTSWTQAERGRARTVGRDLRQRVEREHQALRQAS